MQSLAIILLSVVAAVVYGIVHDQITARICIEYFTMAHPRLIDSESPTVLGLFWGVVATWWVGLPLGLGLAVAARAGRQPKLTVQHLIQPLLVLLLCMFVVATFAGVIGYITATPELMRRVQPLGSRIPESRHTPFLIDVWAHSASYLAGLLGGITLWFITWRRRERQGIVRKPGKVGSDLDI